MSAKWYLLREDEQYGPFSWEELFSYAQSGNVDPNDRVWTEGYPDWVLARDLEPLSVIFSVEKEAPKKKKLIYGAVGGALLVFLVSLFVLIFDPGSIDSPLARGGVSSSDYAHQAEDGTYNFGYDNAVRYTGNQTLQVDENSTFGSQSATLDAENPRFSHEGVAIELSSLFLEEETAAVEMIKMLAPPPFDGSEVNAYRFQVREPAEYDGLYTITLPYEDNGGEIGAGYFNEATETWEPVQFELDEANNQVIITTHHLSTYGSVTIIGEGTRAARIATGLFDGSSYLYNFTDQHGSVVEELINNNMTPGQQAWNLGKSITDDWFKAAGIIFKIEGLAYGSEFISSLSDAMGNVGTALALTQLAIDYGRGDQRAMAVNAFNTTQGLAIGKWGTKALKVSMIGVTAIDYALGQFRTEALRGRKDIWIGAYQLYYANESKVKRTPTDWYYRLKDIFDNAESPEQFHRMLDTELNHYTYLFWNEDETTQGFYQAEAQKHAWTGGAGLNERLKREIADNHKEELLDGYLKSVFMQLEMRERQAQIDDYYREFDSMRAMFNQVVTFTIEEAVAEGEKPEYAGYIIQFGPLNDDVDAWQWTGRMRDDGTARTRFTVLSHLMAGAPDELRFYENMEDLEKGKAAHVVDFTISLPETNIYIGELEEQDLTGRYHGYITITDMPFLEEARLELERQIAESESSGQRDSAPRRVDIFDMETEMAQAMEECEPALSLMLIEIMELMIGIGFGLTIELQAEEDINNYSGRVSLDPSDATIDPASIEEKLSQFEHFAASESTSSPGDSDDDMFGNLAAMLLGLNEDQPITALYKNGELSFKIFSDDNEGTYYYRGRLTADDTLTGTVNVPVDGEIFLEGTWRVTLEE